MAHSKTKREEHALEEKLTSVCILSTFNLQCGNYLPYFLLEYSKNVSIINKNATNNIIIAEFTIMWYSSSEHTGKKKEFKRIVKSHRPEYDSCFANLHKVLDAFDEGFTPLTYKVGFFRSEGSRLYRIGQTQVAHSKAIRLYVYPDEKTQLIHILGIGTKETQGRDINEAKSIIKRIQQMEAPND